MKRGEHYADAVYRLRDIMDALESSLENAGDGSILTTTNLATHVAPYTLSADQAALALLALAELSIVEWPGSGRFSQQALVASAPFRAGVREGIGAVGRGVTAPHVNGHTNLPGAWPH